MITESQKQHVREVVEKILAQIDWPPERLCKLAIRAALAVSKSPEGAEFRGWAEGWLAGENKNLPETWKRAAMAIDDYLIMSLEIYDRSGNSRDNELPREILTMHHTTGVCEAINRGHLIFNAALHSALINAKLTAKLRGEKLGISEIIKEMKIKEEV